MTATHQHPATYSPETDDVRHRVDAALVRFLDKQEQRFDDLITAPHTRSQWHTAISTLRSFLIGGKRLRPAFCYWGWRGSGGQGDEEGIIAAAASLELLHGFALIHDDLIDESDTRRGAPSLHRQHATLHQEAGGRGSSRSFGNSVALLLGDLCLAWFHEMLASSGLAADRMHAARELVGRSFAELVLGQYLDLAEQADSEHSVERACTVIHYKTAKYTIERPLHLGGVLAGASPELLSAYTDYALPLGEAFQLRDDLLGAFGDPAITGKPVADDLRTRKATVLVATARHRAGADGARAIDRMFTGPELTEEQVEQLQTIIVDTGARSDTEHLIQRKIAMASRALETMPASAEARGVLANLIVAATDRAH